MKETTNSKVLTLLLIDRFLPVKIPIPIVFSSENYYSDCIVIAKTIFDLVGGTTALIFMAGCSYLLCKATNKHNSLWSDQGLALLTLSWDKNWDSHSLVNGYPSFYPRIVLVAPSPDKTSNWANIPDGNAAGQPWWSTEVAEM